MGGSAPVTTVERSVDIPADADEAWAVLADFGDLARWTRPVQHCWLVSDQTEGLGAVRRVQVARMAMIEEIVTWDPERALGYTITGLPPIVRHATNTWTLAPAVGGTRVTLTAEIDTGSRPPLSLVARAIAKRLAVASELMVADLAAEVARRAEAVSAEPIAEPGA